MAYAVYAGDPYYHLVASAGGYHTLCGLSTKGGRRGVREIRPAARVTLEPPPRYLYDPCPLCEPERAKSENLPQEGNGDGSPGRIKFLMEDEDATHAGPPSGRGDDDKVTNELSEASLPGPAAEPGESSPRDFLVLVADDEVDCAVMLSMDLQVEGYRVVTAQDGEQAVQVASQVRPDIILMDIGMPGLDRLGAARRIREDDATSGIPIIALTAFVTGGFRQAAGDADIDGYLTKPVDFRLLHELMRRLIKR